MLRPAVFLSALAFSATGCDKTPGTPDGPPDGTTTVPIHFQEDFDRDYLRVDFEGERVFEGSISTFQNTGLATVVPVFADTDGGEQRVTISLDTLGADNSLTGAVDFDPQDDAAVVVCFYRHDSASETPATFRLRPVDAVPSYAETLPTGTTRCPAVGP
jgi:hypothetical protein